MINLTYKLIMRITGHSLPQLKRYALELFGEEAKAVGGKGIERAFEIFEAFLLYFMGLLVEGYKLKLAEAKDHVWVIYYELLKRGLLPTLKWLPSPMPYIMVRIHQGPKYEFRLYSEGGPDEGEIMTFPELQGLTAIEVKEGYYRWWLPARELLPETKPGPVYEILVTPHIGNFMRLYKALL